MNLLKAYKELMALIKVAENLGLGSTEASKQKKALNLLYEAATKKEES